MMRSAPRLSWLLLVLSTVACAELGVPPDSVPVEVTIRSWPAVAPLDSVELCEIENEENCALTDSNGKATLRLPADEETGFTATREGYGRYLIPLRTGEGKLDLVSYLSSDTTLKELHEGVSSTYPHPETGRISCEITSSGFAGVTFALLDEYGQPVTAKLFYRTVEEGKPVWRDDLGATTDVGVGDFLELTPGEYSVEVGGNAVDCEPIFGWPGFEPNRIRVPVRASYATRVVPSCNKP